MPGELLRSTKKRRDCCPKKELRIKSEKQFRPLLSEMPTKGPIMSSKITKRTKSKIITYKDPLSIKVTPGRALLSGFYFFLTPITKTAYPFDSDSLVT